MPEQSERLLTNVSVEMTAKDIPALAEASALLPAGTAVSVTYLAGESTEARVEAAAALREFGFVPVPHFSARRFRSEADLATYLERLAARAAIDRAFVIAGDLERPDGPYADSLDLIRSGLLEAHGVTAVGVAGHPEGHSDIPEDILWRALREKAAALAERGLAGEIVTQFVFDADPVLAWLDRLRAEGIDLPVRVGMPGPAGVATLLRFAARCGVGTSAKVLAKYGISAGRLLGSAGPDRLWDALSGRLDPRLHGTVRAHLYPFGGLARTAAWIRDRRAPLAVAV